MCSCERSEELKRTFASFGAGWDDPTFASFGAGWDDPMVEPRPPAELPKPCLVRRTTPLNPRGAYLLTFGLEGTTTGSGGAEEELLAVEDITDPWEMEKNRQEQDAM